MTKTIGTDDLKTIEQIAKSYNLTMVEFGKAIVNQTKKRSARQFRVSEEEFKNISRKAEEAGLSITMYCERACGEFLARKVLDKNYSGIKQYGNHRTKRISLQFRSAEIENELLKVADLYNLEVGALIRFCALKY